MFGKTEIVRGVRGGLRFLMLDMQAAECFDPSKRAAIRSFWTLLFLVPSGLVMGWYANRPYFEQYGVSPVTWLTAQLIGTALTLLFGLWLVWQVATWENLTPGYPRYLNALNWYGVVSTVVFLPVFLLSESDWLPLHERQTVGIAYYVLTLVYDWFIAWRTLRANPFMAAGIAMILPIVGTALSDFINIKLYGIARPFEALLAAAQ